MRDGEILLGALADGLHNATDPGGELETETRAFMAFARQNFSEAAVGAAIGSSGLSSGEVLAMLTRGDWDPFANVQMPEDLPEASRP